MLQVRDLSKEHGQGQRLVRAVDGQTSVVVTHGERVASTTDRVISMRDGTFVDDTSLAGGPTGPLGGLIGLGG